jgi:hypothetical protein
MGVALDRCGVTGQLRVFLEERLTPLAEHMRNQDV